MKYKKHLLAGLLSGVVIGVVAYFAIEGEQFLIPLIAGAVAALVVPLRLLIDDHFDKVIKPSKAVVEVDRQQTLHTALRIASLVGVTLVVCYVFQLPMHLEGAPWRRLRVLWSPWLWTFGVVFAIDVGVRAVLKSRDSAGDEDQTPQL